MLSCQKLQQRTMVGIWIQLLLLTVLLSAVQGIQTCHTVNVTISAEKDECPYCVLLVTSGCTGYCQTKDLVFKNVLAPMQQHVCTYGQISYQKVKLPMCPPGVDPFYTYPVAQSCECNTCKMEYTDCGTKSIAPDFCTAKTLPR
ncbi:lutropin subunit beta-like [Rhinatrema bivittatum]|uniref:lutropin subunit beta-like n=1 Tax=Rhinatrema bivittatum TaxID=194408 RepID=UPI00112C7BE9|nr:lutropin subunit beta-like [Rhinatrema bivittatum]